MRTNLILLLCVAAALTAPAGAAPPTTSKTQIRNNPPSVTDRRLRDAIWKMFKREDFRRAKAPVRSLDHLFMQTKVRTTRVPGLCRYDSLQFEFEKVDPKAEGPDAETRPIGVTATSYYSFTSPPADDYEAIVDYSQPQPAKTCASIADDLRFFSASDERDATLGYRAFVNLQQADQAGMKFTLECERYVPDDKPCPTIVAALKPSEIDSVEECDSDPGLLCFKVSVADRSIEVITTGYRSPGPPPGQIIRAKVWAMITIGERLID